MKTRVIAGIAMVPLALILYWGGLPLVAAAIVVAGIGVTEFYNGWEALGVHPSKMTAYVMIAVLYAGHLLLNYTNMIPNPDVLMPWFLMAWLVGSVTLSMFYGWKINDRGAYDSMATALGLVYVVFFSYHIVLINTTQAFAFIWLVVLASFGSDVCAYFSGYFLGKHKLAPVLSPKKTIEGAVGGVIGASLCCTLFGYLACPEWLIHCMIIGCLGGAVSQCGDLTASAFKRKMGIKDYGNLIPGHGGIMDRFDSVIFTAPFVYYYIILVVTPIWK